MTAFFYQATVETPQGFFVCGLLAENRVQAIAKAVAKCKASYGNAGRVVLLVPVCSAGDFRRISRSKLYRILDNFDQFGFIALSLGEFSTRLIQLTRQIIDLLRETQEFNDKRK